MAMPVISVEKKDVSLTCFVWILPCGFMCTCASRYVPLFYDPLQGGSRYHSSLVVFIPFAEDNSSIPRSGAIIDVHGVDPVRTYWQVGQKYCVCRAEIQGRPYLPLGGGLLYRGQNANYPKPPREPFRWKEGGKYETNSCIDDDPSIRLLYEAELSEEGYDVFSSDGKRGLLQLIAAKRPDLILLDVKLRRRSGLSPLHDIRNAYHGIPVIGTMAYATSQIDPKSVGADAYVTKNPDLTELKQQIKKCLATPGPLHGKGIIPRKNAQTTVVEPAVQLSMRFHK